MIVEHLRLHKPGTAVVLELLVIWMAIQIFKHVDAIPYNVRELFVGRFTILSVLSFWLYFQILLGLPVWLASFFSHNHLKSYLIFPIAVMGSGIAAWLLLRISVPVEGIYDIIGTPVLKWYWEFESIYRFAFLFAVSLIVLSFSATTVLIINSPRQRKHEIQAVCLYATIGAGILFFCHLVVVVHAATDNLTELMANGGGPISSMMLCLWLLNLGILGSYMSFAITNGEFSTRRFLLSFIFSCLLGYGILQLGLENRVEKYGMYFSALQFLLSPGRDAMVSEGNVFIRYSLVHLMILLAMSIIQIPYWNMIKKRKTD